MNVMSQYEEGAIVIRRVGLKASRACISASPLRETARLAMPAAAQAVSSTAHGKLRIVQIPRSLVSPLQLPVLTFPQRSKSLGAAIMVRSASPPCAVISPPQLRSLTIIDLHRYRIRSLQLRLLSRWQELPGKSSLRLPDPS